MVSMSTLLYLWIGFPDEAVAINLNFKENTIYVTIKIKVLFSRPYLRQFISVIGLPDEGHRSKITE